MRSALLLALLSAIVAAGCGGGSTEPATQVETQQEDQPLSKARYIALGDVICKNHESRREDLESQTVNLGPLSSAAQAHQVAGLLRKQGDNLKAETDELQAVHPPSADMGTVSSILSLIRAKATVIDSWAKAYDDLNTAQIRALQVQIGLATAKAQNRARAYGFIVCGQS